VIHRIFALIPVFSSRKIYSKSVFFFFKFLNVLKTVLQLSGKCSYSIVFPMNTIRVGDTFSKVSTVNYFFIRCYSEVYIITIKTHSALEQMFAFASSKKHFHKLEIMRRVRLRLNGSSCILYRVLLRIPSRDGGKIV